MLVLTRKKDESVIIDDHITVRILRLKGNSVRIGIEAPKDVPLHRDHGGHTNGCQAWPQAS